MKVTFWKKKNCLICDKSLQTLNGNKNVGAVEIKSLEREEDRRVIKQLSKQRMFPPVIEIDGVFVRPPDLRRHLSQFDEVDDSAETKVIDLKKLEEDENG